MVLWEKARFAIELDQPITLEYPRSNSSLGTNGEALGCGRSILGVGEVRGVWEKHWGVGEASGVREWHHGCERGIRGVGEASGV